MTTDWTPDSSSAAQRWRETPARTVGICGAKPDGPTWLICDLPAGHAGWHGADQLAEHPLGVSSRCSWTEREAAPTEYEREAVEVAALTLEERYRKQIEELRQRFDEASAEVVRLFTLSASEGLRADAAEERVKELRDLETAARAAVAETKAYREANAARVGPMSAAFAAFVAAVDSLPPKPDTQS